MIPDYAYQFFFEYFLKNRESTILQLIMSLDKDIRNTLGKVLV